MIPVVIHGAEGRMGLLIRDLVEGAPDMELVGLVSEPGKGRGPGEFHSRLPLLGQDQMAAELPAGCAIIDFSLAAALDGLLGQAELLGSSLVIGTTGFSEDQQARLTEFSQKHPVVHAPNYSIGIPVLQMLLQMLARTLPAGFDAEQIETHHATKIDKPSGTAGHLAEVFEGVRKGGPVPTHSQRLGGVIGEHTWTFSDQEETLVLTHRAHSRHAFMRGILPSVRFVHGQDKGMFGLVDVLKATAGPG